MTRQINQRGKPTESRLIRSPGYVEEVFGIIRADLMSLRIPPDTRISIERLVRELGVSQTPIREALSMLEAMGLVTKKRFVGYCSAPHFTRSFGDRYDIAPRDYRRLHVEGRLTATAA